MSVSREIQISNAGSLLLSARRQKRVFLSDSYNQMARGTNKQFSTVSSRQIPQIRLYDDGSLETRYEILNKLGEGSFGTVSRVKNKENQFFYAMKTIPKKPGNKSKASSLDNEVKLLTEVNHSNLIQLYEVLESSQNLYLIVDLCEGGELGGYVQKHGPLPEETVKQIMSKLINALHYLHKMDIVHRDLKLENILLKNVPASKTDEFDIRVTDFGLSSKKSITCTDSLFNDYCGTPLYMAPEILENKNYSALCDVWAMGIIMYYLISGRHPYVANEERRLLEIIRSQKLRFDSEKFRNLSSEGLDFLQGMLVYDTVHRRTMGELTVHSWLTGRSDKEPIKDIITMMREFQAENDRHQTTIENNLTTLINATTDQGNLTRISNDQSPIQSISMINKQTVISNDNSNQSRISGNISELRTSVDKNKLNIKTPSRLTCDTPATSKRATHDIHGSLSNIHVRVKQSDRMSELANSNRIRQTFNSPSVSSSSSSSTLVTKLRPGNIRRGRSESQADLHLPSKFLPLRQQQHQRTALNGFIDTVASPFPSVLGPSSNDYDAPNLSKTPLSSTATALMMINKQYSNNLSPCVPTIMNTHQHNTKDISFYPKRYSNHT